MESPIISAKCILSIIPATNLPGIFCICLDTVHTSFHMMTSHHHNTGIDEYNPLMLYRYRFFRSLSLMVWQILDGSSSHMIFQVQFQAIGCFVSFYNLLNLVVSKFWNSVCTIRFNMLNFVYLYLGKQGVFQFISTALYRNCLMIIWP